MSVAQALDTAMTGLQKIVYESCIEVTAASTDVKARVRADAG